MATTGMKADAAPGAAHVADRWPALAKAFHWVTALVVVAMLALGFAMTYRGNALGIWDDLTNNLFSTHKLLGFLLLWFIVLRLARRFIGRVPRPEPSLPGWQQGVATVNHVAMYALLIAMPLLGWTAASLFPALELFGTFSLPALTAPDTSPDKAMYETVAGWHGIGALILLALVALHVSASLYHLVVRRDGVFQRMWPGSR